MADKKIMTPEEKALLQARHRQEEAEARNRKKERDTRTHRLVQEGAILESIVPHIKEMDLDSLKTGTDDPATRNVNAQVLLPKVALTHHLINQAVVSPTGLVRSAEGFIRCCRQHRKEVPDMAIYHMQAKVVSRGSGRSAVAASAYMSCSRMYNDYDGIQHDYTRKHGLIYQEVMLPPMAHHEWNDREQLWNAVEETEKTKDSRLAREFVVALPLS